MVDPKAVEECRRVWTAPLLEAAKAEGWFLSHCHGSIHSDWQIQKIDEPDLHPLANGALPPELHDDDEAVRLVLAGDQEHHKVAQAFFEKHAPAEMQYMRSLGQEPQRERSAG